MTGPAGVFARRDRVRRLRVRSVLASAAVSAWVVLVALLMAGCTSGVPEPSASPSTDVNPMALPPPETDGTTPLESVLSSRRSIREFSTEMLTEAAFGQLLCAAQGVTSPDGKRTAPSAGARYPLEVYAVTADGVYHYLPDGHRVETIDTRDLRALLADAAASQEWVAAAPVVLVIVGVEARTAARYGDRAERYVTLEAGHSAQNLLLQATALGLAATPVGAFDDERVRTLFGLPDDHAPLVVVPVGHAASSSAADVSDDPG